MRQHLSTRQECLNLQKRFVQNQSVPRFCLKNLKPNAHIFKHIFFIVQIFAENESLLKEPDTA